MENRKEKLRKFRNFYFFPEADRLEHNIDPEWLEVDINKPVKLVKKVLIPNFRHPGVGFKKYF